MVWDLLKLHFIQCVFFLEPQRMNCLKEYEDISLKNFGNSDIDSIQNLRKYLLEVNFWHSENF